MKIEMHEKKDWNDLNEPGDYLMATRPDESKFPVIVCPKCLRPGGCPQHTLMSEDPLTIAPSFRCVSDGGRTCWHGWVKNGVMEEV